MKLTAFVYKTELRSGEPNARDKSLDGKAELFHPFSLSLSLTFSQRAGQYRETDTEYQLRPETLRPKLAFLLHGRTAGAHLLFC